MISDEVIVSMMKAECDVRVLKFDQAGPIQDYASGMMPVVALLT